jgi:hypothetical protein
VSITYLLGDTREQIATIPDGSVSLVACSPPFIALRSYLPADHPMKSAEIGSEPDPATFLDTLLALTAEWGRVLAPWGSIAIELGDTYSASGSGGENNLYTSGYSGGRTYETQKPPCAAGVRAGNWPRPKCLALVPQLYAASLAYGRNLLTGDSSPAGQWLVRNMIVWHRPNPAVGALGDKFRPSTSYITVATRSAKRWFDLTAVRTANPDGQGVGKPAGVRTGESITYPGNGGSHRMPVATTHAAGAPPLDAWFDQHDTWTITTQPSSLAHYAMWPPKLAERLVLSMCPAEVCGTCGEPRRRVEGKAEYVPSATYGGGITFAEGERVAVGANQWRSDEGAKASLVRQAPTLGWTDCGHDNYRPGVVLDPFAGTGTTLAVADLHGRDAIGIDIDKRNRELVDARHAECRRALFGTKPETVGQMGLFEGGAA